MISDRRPHNTDNDNTIRQWVRDHRHTNNFTTKIELVINCKDEPNIAIIHWGLVSQPVRRYFQ